MFNAIYCEFYKLKKSHFYSSILLISCLIPLTLFLGWSIQGHYVIWNEYFFQMEQMTFMFLTIPLSALIAAYIFSKEFSNKTMSTLLCYPLNKVKIFFSKLVVIAFLIAMVIFFQLLLTMIFGFFLNHSQFTIETLFIHLKLTLFHLLTLYFIAPIPIFITLLCKNVLVPLIYGFVVSVSNVFIFTLTNSRNCGIIATYFKDNCIYIPTYHPLLSYTNFMKQSSNGTIIISTNPPLPTSSMVVDLIAFIIVLTLSILYFYKADVK